MSLQWLCCDFMFMAVTPCTCKRYGVSPTESKGSLVSQDYDIAQFLRLQRTSVRGNSRAPIDRCMLSLRRLCMLLSGRCRFASTNLSTWYPALGHHCAVSSAAASRAATAAAAAVTPTTVTLTSCHASSQLLKAGQRLHTATSYCANSAAAGAVGQLLPPLPGMSQLEPLSLEETLQAVAVPPIERNLGPRVEHIYVSTPGTLSEVIATALQLPQWFVLELIRFGAVHHCPVMPQPSPKVGKCC
jgi:hypothetical protein